MTYLKYTALSLREKCPYLEIFWSVFSRIRTEYGPEKLRIWTAFGLNTDQKNYEHEHSSRSGKAVYFM